MASRKILLVDDEKELSEVLASLLELWGYTVDIANSGNEAVKMATQFNYSLILSDVRMPDGDGVSLIRRLQENQNSTPFFIMSGYNDYSEEQILALGVLRYFTKPLNHEKLREALVSFFGPESETSVGQ